MRIRIATKGVHYSQAAKTLDEANASYGPVWVELDGHRTDCAVSSRVVNEGDERGSVSLVTITFVAAVEMVIVGANGEILTEDT